MISEKQKSDGPLVYFRNQFTDCSDHPVDATFRKLIQKVGCHFMIGLFYLDGISHDIRNFRFKFAFEPVECPPYPIIPRWVTAGQTIDRITFDVIHYLLGE